MADSSAVATVVRRALAASSPRARLEVIPGNALISVRARGAALARVARALGVEALPAPNAVTAVPGGECLWVRPDEWWMAGAALTRASRMAELDAAVGADDGAVVDISASRVVLELSGTETRDVLASCCPLDLHPRAFAPGRCAQSVVAKAPVLVQLCDASPRWRLYVRPSLVSYVVAWLTDAMDGDASR